MVRGRKKLRKESRMSVSEKMVVIMSEREKHDKILDAQSILVEVRDSLSVAASELEVIIDSNVFGMLDGEISEVLMKGKGIVDDTIAALDGSEIRGLLEWSR